MKLKGLFAAFLNPYRILSALLIIILSGCDDPEPIIECGCDSQKYVLLDNEPGIIVNTLDGYLLLTPNLGYISLCDQTDQSILVDGLMVTIKGQLKKMCGTTGPDKWYVVNHIRSFNILPSSDSLFLAPPVEIHVINSADYGYSPGYGYRMTKTTQNGAFKIIQPIIPAVGGNKTFKTPSDAFKVAVLVAYRSTEYDLPSLTVYDLQYLLSYP